MKRDFVDVTVKLPRKFVEDIDRMVEDNLYGSRSAFIRRAVKEYLERECRVIRA